MAQLPPQDRLTLAQVLAAQPAFQDQDRIRLILATADLASIIPQIDLHGPSLTVVGRLLLYLESYGALPYGQDALGAFLSVSLTPLGGLGATDRKIVAHIIEIYHLSALEASEPPLVGWQGPSTTDAYLEKIIGEDTLHPIAFLEQGLACARAVALVHIESTAPVVATGFLISPHLLMTNEHVLFDAKLLAATTVRFNVQRNAAGQDLPWEVMRPKPGGIFHVNKALDYAIVELDGTPGARWGTLSLRASAPQVKERVYIIQHPGGRPKQISFENNLIAYVDGRVVQYVTSTLPGSSGSPVFNRQWQVVALHHAGGDLIEPSTQRLVLRNEGIVLEAILHDLPSAIRAELDQVSVIV